MRLREYLKTAVLSGAGGALYVLLELIWRGHSHWTMFFLGGTCFVLIGAVNEFVDWCVPIWKQALIGAMLITALEFLTGCVFNLWLGWDVWDYSGVPGNILGQVCLPYMILWVPAAIAAIVLDDWLRYWMFGEERPHYCLWAHGEEG